MKSHLSRLVAAAVALAIVVVLMGAAAPASSLKEPGKLIILSTTDVKGKNEPCG